MNIYKDKKILVTGGTGMIGIPLVKLLIAHGAKVRIVSLDDGTLAHPEAEFLKLDLTEYDNCLKACEGMDYIFHLAGIKGSPKIIQEKPATFYEAMILFNTNMLRAARKTPTIERYLYTSSVGVYSPFMADGSNAEVFYEDEVWKTFPSENDKAPGWAKRMGEMQCESVERENPKIKFSIVRPANVYGPYDNFDPKNSMVVPANIKRAVDGENPFVAWGDGSPIRDFIHAKDVALGMIAAMEKSPGAKHPINLGSGTGYRIKDLVETIVNNLENKPQIHWDTTKPSGDKKRLFDIKRAKETINWSPTISLNDGIKETMEWYQKNKDIVNKRYNVFTDNKKEKKKVLVCGATGFIGRNIAESLCENEEYEVYGTYLKSEPLTNPKIKMIKIELTNKEEVDKIMQGKDIIIQAAATTSGSKDILTRPYIHVADNAIMNSVIFRSAHDHKVGHVVFFSCSVMYQSSPIPLKESDFDASKEIFKSYFGVGWTKVYIEKMCEFYSRLGNTKYTTIRHTNVYGPHDKYDLEKSHVFGATMTKVLTSKDNKLRVWGTGEEERDLIYVADLVDFVEKAIKMQTTPFELVNVGAGKAVSIRNLAERIINHSRLPIEMEFDTSKPTIKTSLSLNCEKAKNVFGWECKTPLDEGIRQTMDWYRKNLL
ncbi:MAG: NAD-dependent epimerase/dehydratase family protein [Nanoarchaeota archaeon]